MPTPAHRATWLGSDRLLARAVAQPVARFLRIEAAGGLLLLAATAVALLWANSPWQAGYDALWHTELGLRVGEHALTLDLRHWVNEGLMALFFLVIGMEIKSELVNGALARRERAALPVVAAIGGMVVPALLYLAVSGGDGGHGWGIPMATDVAFALAVLALLGDRVPDELKVLLLALAIVDDIGAIAVIAIAYSGSLHLGWAAGALALLGLVVVLRQVQVRFLPAFVVLGVGVWWMTLEAGIHATIAGVAMGLLTPARPLLARPDADRIADELSADEQVEADEVRAISFRIRESVPLTERLQAALHPWTSYVIVPVFALANAGISLSPSRLGDALGSRPTYAVAVGLVVGKAVGVIGGVALARRLGLGELPPGVNRQHVLGLGLVAGVGFTVSLFVADLAFPGEAIGEDAKLGVLLASVLAAGLATLVLRRRPAPA